MAKAKSWADGSVPTRGPGVNAAIRRLLQDINTLLAPEGMGVSVLGEQGDTAALGGSKSGRVYIAGYNREGSMLWKTLSMPPRAALGWVQGFLLGWNLRS